MLVCQGELEPALALWSRLWWYWEGWMAGDGNPSETRRHLQRPLVSSAGGGMFHLVVDCCLGVLGW